MMSFELPFPPSVNHTWMRGKGNRLYSCPKVKEFHKVATLLITEAKLLSSVVFPIKSRLSVTMILNEKDKRRRDIDNSSKSLFDACTKNGIWLDDSQVDELIIKRGVINKENPNVFVIISELLKDES